MGSFLSNRLSTHEMREGTMLHLVTSLGTILLLCESIRFLGLKLGALHRPIPYLLVIQKLVSGTLLLTSCHWCLWLIYGNSEDWLLFAQSWVSMVSVAVASIITR